MLNWFNRSIMFLRLGRVVLGSCRCPFRAGSEPVCAARIRRMSVGFVIVVRSSLNRSGFVPARFTYSA